MVHKYSKKVKENTQVLEYIYNNHPPAHTDVRLSDISEKDSIWDTHRNNTAIVGDIYRLNAEFERLGRRMGSCSGYLKFGIGESGLILKEASFCRVRYCDTCQWRKSMYWHAMIHQHYDRIRSAYPHDRFIFLTLTVENPHIKDLRSTIQHMNQAWKKLTKRKVFLGVVNGWIRTTEITRDKTKPNTHAHPHFHCLIMVKPSYFGKDYIKQMDWVRLWADCLKVDYLPSVDVQAVKKKGKSKSNPMTDEDVKSAVIETLKYAVKSDDMIGDGTQASNEWFYELTRQTHKLRFVATGGALKDALKDEDISDEKMISPTENEEPTDLRRLHFTYRKIKKGYIYNPIHNQ